VRASASSATAAAAASAVVGCADTCVGALPSWLFAGTLCEKVFSSGWQAGIESVSIQTQREDE